MIARPITNTVSVGSAGQRAWIGGPTTGVSPAATVRYVARSCRRIRPRGTDTCSASAFALA